MSSTSPSASVARRLTPERALGIAEGERSCLKDLVGPI